MSARFGNKLARSVMAVTLSCEIKRVSLMHIVLPSKIYQAFDIHLNNVRGDVGMLLMNFVWKRKWFESNMNNEIFSLIQIA